MKTLISTLLLSTILASSAAYASPIVLEEQGSFAIVGSVVQKDGTFSEEHFKSRRAKGLR